MKKVGSVILGCALAVVFSSAAIANAEGHAAHGHIHYEAENQVKTRDVSMTMERDGNGNATFILEAGDFRLTSNDGFMKEKSGGQIAYVAFRNAWTAGGETAHLLFKGLKLKGDNQMVYQGTLYKTTDSALSANGETFAECLAEIKETGKIDENWKISGAFKFKKNLNQSTNLVE